MMPGGIDTDTREINNRDDARGSRSNNLNQRQKQALQGSFSLCTLRDRSSWLKVPMNGKEEAKISGPGIETFSSFSEKKLGKIAALVYERMKKRLGSLP